MLNIIEPKVTFTQALIVPGIAVTIGSMTDDKELTAFSQRLNEVCDDIGVPPKGKARQTTLAKIFDVSQKGARKWLEAEGYCSITMGKRIANWGGVSFDWLMTGEGHKRPSAIEISPAADSGGIPALRAAAQSTPGVAQPTQSYHVQTPLLIAAGRIDRSSAISAETKAAITRMLQALIP